MKEFDATKEEIAISKAIDQQLIEEGRRHASQYRILLLGSGQSGKSTVLKQIKLIYGHGFSPKEIDQFKRTLRWNLQESICQLCKASGSLQIPFSREALSLECQEMVRVLSSLTSTDLDFLRSPDTVRFVQEVMEDTETFKALLSHSSEFNFHDAITYFLSNMGRLIHPDYTPSDDDILKARCQTNGVIETVVPIEGKEMVYIDVAGQKSQRRKWLTLFEGVTSVVFVVAISEYDQMMEEDIFTNRVMDALELFEQVVNSHYLKSTSMVLLLNKKDLFEKKIPQVPLCDYFPDFKDGSDVKKATHFLKRLFLSKVKNNSSRSIFTHVTCATDTTSCKYVLASMNDTIMNQGFAEMGLE